jgi:hypothetical protein
MKRKTLSRKRFKGFSSSSQGSIEKIDVFKKFSDASLTICEVTKVRMKNMSVDIKTNNGVPIKNVPIVTKGGLENDEVWGELEVPSVGSYVIIAFINDNEEAPIMIGTILPYLHTLYQTEQVPVNTASKAFTKKLLEDIDPAIYRKIFKSGTTIEVQEDGTIILEVPDGSYVKLDSTAGTFYIEDSSGNVIQSDATKVTINGNLEVLQ